MHALNHYVIEFRSTALLTYHDAHVLAFTEVEAILLLKQHTSHFEKPLKVRDMGLGKLWLVAGQRFNDGRPRVVNVEQHVTFNDITQPFRRFLFLYESTIRQLPLPSLIKSLYDGGMAKIPTDEQFGILEHETGVSADDLRAWALCEYYGMAWRITVQQVGKKEMLRHIDSSEYLACDTGHFTMDVLEKLAAFTFFRNIQRHRMTSGELLYFCDVKNCTRSDQTFYTGASWLGDLSNKAIRHLATIDPRFPELINKDAK